MVERLGDVEARVGSVRQLSAVVTAMRGIAAARSREANTRLDGVRVYAQTVGAGIGQALVLLPGGGTAARTVDSTDRHMIVALCAEQGFAGAFSAHVLDAVAELMSGDSVRADLLLIGDRGGMTAIERNMRVDASMPMAAHADQITNLANRIAERLFDRARQGGAMRVTLVHAMADGTQAGTIVRKALLPFDYSRFPPVNRTLPPLITLPPGLLLARLTEEYIFAELCEALLFSYAAENEARMHAMVAAHENVGRKLDELTARARLLRQEAITSEVIELASGART